MLLTPASGAVPFVFGGAHIFFFALRRRSVGIREEIWARRRVSETSYKGSFRTSCVEAPMQRIGFVVSPGFQVVHFAALSVFECANDEIGEPVYDVRLLSEAGGSIRSSTGASVATE